MEHMLVTMKSPAPLPSRSQIRPIRNESGTAPTGQGLWHAADTNEPRCDCQSFPCQFELDCNECWLSVAGIENMYTY